MKKALLTFLTFVTIILCVTVLASCGEEEYSKGLLYNNDGSTEFTCAVDGLGECKDTKIIIPEKNDEGNTVVAIYMSMNSFMDCSHVTEMILPETLCFFRYNYQTMTREMPNLKFNEYKFGKYLGTKDNPYYAIVHYSNRLGAEIEMHPDTKIIASRTFQNMENLESADIPDGIKYVGAGAYRNCPKLTSISIPPSVIAIDEGPFWDCTALESVTIPGTLKNVCSHMFVDCTALETVIIEEGIETIGYGAFSGCTALKDVILPSGVKTVSMSAFNGCSSLTDIVFKDGLEVIGDAFNRCSNLETVIIPNSLRALQYSVFDDCYKLKYNELAGALYLGNEENPYVVLVKPISINVTLDLRDMPKTTSAIRYGAFKDHSKLKAINIPEGVEWIGQNTFKNCTSLSHVYIPSTAKGIHSWAFKDCVTLWKIEFGGTKEQWNLMKENELGRHQGWAEGSKINKVYCSDGVIEITEEDR